MVVTAAIACGQTQSQPGDSDGVDDDTHEVGGSGGSAGSGGSVPVVAGTGANPPYPMPCPPEQPKDGESCIYGFGASPPSCQYPGRPGSCGFAMSPTTAYCEAGVWRVQLGEVATGCAPLMPLSCPETMPAVAASCGENGAAFYPEPCTYATEQCAKLSVSCLAGRWEIGACAAPVCPIKPPEQHSACSADYRGFGCAFADGDCAVTAECSAQGWEVERDCTLAQGGAGGEGGAP